MVRLRAMTRKECCKKYNKCCYGFDDVNCTLFDEETCRICQNQPAKVNGKYIMVRSDENDL